MSSTPLTLDQLKTGQRATIEGFLPGQKAYRHRLLTMGLTPGVEIEVKRVAPLGDPMELSVRGYSVSLRRAEASLVTLQARGESAV